MQQQMQQIFVQIPEDIARLAHEQQLGTPQESYTISKLGRGWRWLRFALPGGFLFFVAALVALIIVITTIPSNIFIILLLLGLGELGLFAVVIISALTNRVCPIYPCDNGFILKQSHTKFRVVRWDEIETIWYTTTRLAAKLYTKNRLYTIRCHDGYTLTISGLRGIRSKMDTLDKAISEQFTRRRLPFQLADYQAGHMLSFGPLSMNREGINAHDKTLPWEQVADISLLKDRRLVIYKTGERPEIWLNLPAFKIPNLSILLALFKRIRSGQSEQEAGFEALATYGTAATVVQSRGRIDTLPDGLAALAEEHKLGERRVDQNLGRDRLVSRAAIIALLVFAVILATGAIIGGILILPTFASNGHYPDRGLFIELTLFCLIMLYPATRNIIRNTQQIHNYTYTFERGMLLKRGQQPPLVYHWEDVEIIWRISGTNQRQQPTLLQLVYAHTLQLRSGDKYTLTRLNINQEMLGKIITEQIVPLQIPTIVAAFQAGQTITFGTIQTNHRGITVGKRVLPWSQIRSVTLQGSQLAIYDITQRKPWHRLQAEHIPNLFLLFALADYARDSRVH